jgi:hypothetical protein
MLPVGYEARVIGCRRIAKPSPNNVSKSRFDRQNSPRLDHLRQSSRPTYPQNPRPLKGKSFLKSFFQLIA